MAAGTQFELRASGLEGEASAPLQKGMYIWVLCRVGDVYDPPRPSLVTLKPTGRHIRSGFAFLPSMVAYAAEIVWKPVCEPAPEAAP